ncbi:hypothetical protein [Nocardioides sp.]|uniref:hypothetical protein n=1 Tax=Nocardioides sp. TaxID=35761 RepID=UPI000C96E429|nr:hypothetical protein [Nocardioides sp.]MAS55161.1 hypothetical protein [Pimelobacter sp.]MDE0775599.1 hypothetical protein [Nocardioides sp.]
MSEEGAASEPIELSIEHGRTPWRFWVLPGVLAVLLVALLATSVVLLLDRRQPLPEEIAVPPADIGSGMLGDGVAQQAVSRARLAARTYFTIDFTTVEADMDRLRDLGTPDFVAEYDETAPALARRVRAQRLRLSAVLPDNGVATEYLSQNVAQLLVSVDVTTQRDEQRSTGAYRTRVVLQWFDDQWWVAAVDEVA